MAVAGGGLLTTSPAVPRMSEPDYEQLMVPWTSTLPTGVCPERDVVCTSNVVPPAQSIGPTPLTVCGYVAVIPYPWPISPVIPPACPVRTCHTPL